MYLKKKKGNCVMKILKIPGCWLNIIAHYFVTRNSAIDFSERAIKEKNDQSIMLTARMGRYNVKDALLRCLIRLIIYIILLYGLPVSLLSKMQCIQKSATRIVTGKRLHDHISPILNELHWLPVEKRIIFKLLIMA